MSLDPEEADELARLLAQHEGLEHLRVKKRGDSLTIFSGSATDPDPHARLTHLGGDEWGLSFPQHTGRWEKTPFVDTMPGVVATLVTDFGFLLSDPAGPGRGQQ